MFPVIDANGTARERGRVHGARAKVRIAPKTTELLTQRAEYVPGQGVPLFELRPPTFAGTDFAGLSEDGLARFRRDGSSSGRSRSYRRRFPRRMTVDPCRASIWV